jgi:hypothetical protein
MDSDREAQISNRGGIFHRAKNLIKGHPVISVAISAAALLLVLKGINYLMRRSCSKDVNGTLTLDPTQKDRTLCKVQSYFDVVANIDKRFLGFLAPNSLNYDFSTGTLSRVKDTAPTPSS